MSSSVAYDKQIQIFDEHKEKHKSIAKNTINHNKAFQLFQFQLRFKGSVMFQPHLLTTYNFNNQNTMKNSNKETLKTVLQFIVSVITALLATLGVQSSVCN